MRTVLEETRQKGTAGTGVFGLRLMRKSFDYLANQLDMLYPGLPGDAARFHCAFGRILYIHLSRGDKVAQAVSLVKANQTGLWHAAPDGTELERTAPAHEPRYDASQIGRELAELIAYDRDWDRWFRQQQIEPFRVTYEALSKDPAAVLAATLNRLGLDKAAAADVRPGVAKLADATSRDWVTRFRTEQGGG